MEWIELTGKTIDEARDQALDKLGVHESEAEIEVLEHPSVSMFGRVKSMARIRARVAPVAAPAKEERRRKGGSRSDGGSKAPAKQGQAQKSPASAPAPATAGRSDSADGGGARNGGGGRSDGGRSSGQRRERSGGGDRETTTDDGPTPDPMTAEEVASTVEEFLGGLMSAAGQTVTTSNEIDGDRVDVSVAGDDLGVMVGHRGATADAVLELSKAVMLKVAKGGTEVRLGVDVAGYKGLRREALESFGGDLAQQVADSGDALVLEPMGSIDRKIVHDAVNAVDGVRTESEGQGRDRRVVIRPA